MYRVLLLFSALLLGAQAAFAVVAPLPVEIEYDRDEVLLGKKLFFDPILSKEQDIACASCHSVFGADSRSFSTGHKGAKAKIHTPTIFNAKYNLAQFWNGRAESLKEQASGPIHNPIEMASDAALVEKRLRENEEYRTLFQKAYGSKPTFELTLEALEAFELTLITPNSKFDRYLRGETELSDDEREGYELFRGYGCISCHNGRNLGGNSYQRFGNVIEYMPYEKTMLDRFAVTGKSEDRGVFKVPTLRNIAVTKPYFHDGSVDSLSDAIEIMGYYNLGIALEREEVAKIEAFLRTLTGEMPETWNIE